MRGIGYFLGATLGAALLFFIISFIFLRPRNVDESQVIEFIKNSEKIIISEVPLKEGGFYGNDERIGTNIISKTTYLPPITGTVSKPNEIWLITEINSASDVGKRSTFVGIAILSDGNAMFIWDFAFSEAFYLDGLNT